VKRLAFSDNSGRSHLARRRFGVDSRLGQQLSAADLGRALVEGPKRLRPEGIDRGVLPGSRVCRPSAAALSKERWRKDARLAAA